MGVPGIYEISGKIFPVSGSGLAVFLEGFDTSGKQVCGTGGIELPSLPKKRWQDFSFVFTVSPKAKYLSLKFGNICRKSATVDVCIDELKIKFHTG